jgi:WhiB family redox-sensing transcriptional regulator
MPASPEQLLALLEAPHWKSPGSTSRKTEGPRARRTEGQAAVNLTVVDHIAEGRQVLARAAKLAAEGTPLARRESAALRTAQAMKSGALMGDTSSVRQHRCPACGCFSLITRNELAYCGNRHCAPAGIQRRWNFRDLAFTGPGQPTIVRRSEDRPRDIVDKNTILAFFAPTPYPLSVSTLARIVKAYGLPDWRHLDKPGARFYSLSDVMTAHAVHTAGREPSTCATGGERPACTGLADLFFGATDANQVRVDAAKALCATCPLKETCLEQALDLPVREQHGIFGGLTAAERLQLRRTHRRPFPPTQRKDTRP